MVGIGLSYVARGSDGEPAWTRERLRLFLRAVRLRGVAEVDMFTARGARLEPPAWWWPELQAFVTP